MQAEAERRTRRSFISHLLDHVTTTQVATLFAVFGIGVLIGGSYEQLPEFWNGTSSNLGVELLSIAVTVIVIEQLNRREYKREKMAELITEMRSKSNEVAISAVEQLETRRWLTDGLMESAQLKRANLQHANLHAAILYDANLADADLRNAHLGSAYLRRAYLRSANLQDADIRRASFRDADLSVANLRGAYLSYVDLQGAKLEGTSFSEETTLPDGSKWTPETDMTRFTDPNHPNFWRSDNPNTYTYEGT